MYSFNDFSNAQVAALPRHLRQFVVNQHYEHYTPVDQAVWRYVMRQNYSYLKNVAYYPYIPGLQKAGLTLEHIPDLQEVNDALGKIGWGAVTVDGFIPPAAFMEYQAYRVLVIAADIRQLKHIEYTPAPDIIHESAGHAPIIADRDYHDYLSYFGSIGAKAMFSAQDFELYEAIRALSILKEMPDADAHAVADAEKLVAYRQASMGEPSEMALLSRLHWWTVEYGLIGTLTHPKIYGAGLLSSIGESASCMNPEIKKIPYTIEAVNYSYDITQPQPYLFVTPDFQNLISVLDQFACTMAFRRGGAYGLQKAVECKNTCTAVYSSGLQVSGIFAGFGQSATEDVTFIKTAGPTALSAGNRELAGQGKAHHPAGFSSPVGRLKGFVKAPEDFTAEELHSEGIIAGQAIKLEFESGITVEGLVQGIIANNGKIQLITFNNCTVSDKQGNTLFNPAWGVYDMAVGESITSVYCGAADKDAFEDVILQSATATYHPEYDVSTRQLHRLYAQVRACRETNTGHEFLRNVWQQLQTRHHEDWLCALEILEILERNNTDAVLAGEITGYLQSRAAGQPELKKLIKDGLYLIKHPVEQHTGA